MLKNRLLLYIIAISAVILFIFTVNPHNLSFSPDSMVYLEVSSNIANGQGVVNDQGMVVTHWAPLYSYALAITSYITGLNSIEVGIYLNAFLLFSLILCFYWILKILKVDFRLSILLITALIISHPVIVFGQYLSEGLFMVLLLLSFISFLKWENERKIKYLIFSGIFCGLLFLTRYAGIGFIGGYILYMIILDYKNPGKWHNLLLFILSMIIMVLPWFYYINTFEGNASIRKFDFHLISLDKIKSLFITLGYWFIGSFWSRIILPVILIINLILIKKHKKLIFSLSKAALSNNKKILRLIVFLILSYIAFLLVSISFFDAMTPLGNRILAPVFPFIIVLLGIFLHSLYLNKKLRIIPYSLIFLLIINFSLTVVPQWINHHTEGLGFTKKSWSESPIIEKLKNEPVQIKTYSNGNEILKLHANINSEILPFKSKPEEIKKLRTEMREGNVQIVFFNQVNWRNYLISKEEVLKEFSEFNIRYVNDGLIISSI